MQTETKKRGITELAVFAPWFSFFMLAVLASEAYLVHRTEQFFGGGALNRPFGIDSRREVAAYFMEGVGYDLLFYGTLCAIFFCFPLVRRLNVFQRNVLLAFGLGGVFATVLTARWKIFEYFKNEFDIGVLKELTAGKLTHLFAWVGLEQFLLLLIVPVLLLAFAAILRILGRFGRGIRSLRPGGRVFAILALGWAVLVFNHFATTQYEDLRFGLSNKLSYSTIDKALVAVTDFDGDGFGPLTVPKDPDNRDENIHPYAVDYPANGVDEDALAGDLPELSPASYEDAIPFLESTNGQNVILIVVETFRVDVIDKTIDGREVTPFLNQVANKHAYTDLAYSNYGVTARAIHSLFKGSLHYNESDPSISDELRRLGYKTFAVSAQNETWGDTAKIVGFDHFDKVFDARDVDWNSRELTTWQKMNPMGLTVDSSELNGHIWPIIDKAKNDPFFLYINYQDLHYPYHNPEMDLVFIDKGVVTADFFKAENREAILRQYANAAHHLDKSIQALWEHLSSLGLDDKTMVVIIGDHPDSFYENGLLGHAWTVDEHQRRTPLFIINGKGVYKTPVGQDEIASMVFNTLDPDVQLPSLSFSFDPDKRVFELSALLEEPRQIAWISPDDLVTYDFKTARLQLGKDAPWIRPDEITTGDPKYYLFKSLVHRWESERLARIR